MVDIPAQLQRQIDEVAEYDRLMEEASKPPTDVVEAPDTPPAEAPPVAEVPVKPPEAPKVEEETWKSKYLTLQGMFNADVPRLNGQVKELKGQLTALQAQLTEAQKVKTATPKASSVTSKDAEAFGSDLLDVIKRQSEDVLSVAQAGWDEQRQQLESRIAELTAQTGNVVEQKATDDRARYLANLANLVPDWEAINSDAQFLAWLAEVDPLSGLQRQAYLNNAFQTFDAGRTATLFTAWKSAQVPPAPAAKTAAQQQLERQQQPGGSKATPITLPTDAATRIWTAAEVDKFWVDVRKGVVSGADAQRIEAEIDLAVASGRMTS